MSSKAKKAAKKQNYFMQMIGETTIGQLSKGDDKDLCTSKLSNDKSNIFTNAEDSHPSCGLFSNPAPSYN